MNRWMGFLIIISFVFSVPACAPDPLTPLPIGPSHGWKVLRPLPVGYNLYDIWGQSSANVWAVGMYGTIVIWDGETVRQVDSPTKETLSGLDGWGPDDIYAVGNGDLIHFDGRTWDLTQRYADRDIDDVFCSADGRLYMVGEDGLWYRDELGTHGIVGLPVGDPKIMWLGPDGLLRIGNGGQLWLVENDAVVLEQDFGQAKILFGDGKYLTTEENSGYNRFYHYASRSNWEYSEEDSYTVRAMLDKGSLVFANNGGIIHNAGYDWKNDQGRWINKLAHCGDSEILACGHGGTLLHGVIASDEVVYHEGYDEIGFRSIKSFAGTGPDNIWAGEYWGRVLHFDGESWQQESSGLNGAYYVTHMQAEDDGWVFVAGGKGVSHRDPSGHWSNLPALPDFVWHFHAFSSESIIVAMAHDFLMLDGGQWNNVGSVDGSIYGLSRTPSGQLYSLVSKQSSTLQTWDGTGFTTELDLPQCMGRLLCASEETETLWIAGVDIGDFHNAVVYEYSSGELHKVSNDYELPGYPEAMTENAAGDLFVLSGDQVWRYFEGNWSHEQGLPANESYTTIWSHPDCGVYVQGHPTFYKNFSQE